MKRFSLNLEKLRTLNATQLSSVNGGVKMSYYGGCETQDVCEPPAPGPTMGPIGTKATMNNASTAC